MSRGAFITFEGGEGSGKTTQAARLADRLRRGGATLTVVREPGGTVVGDRVRDLLLDPAHAGLDARAELLLYEAARAELVAFVIRPRLDAGEVVVCDRFFDSTSAYQGCGRGLDLGLVDSLNDFATAGLAPDVTVLLDIDPSLGLLRATGAGADRMESEELAFHRRVRDGFLALASEHDERFVVVSAEGTPAEVADRIADALRGHPALRGMLH